MLTPAMKIKHAGPGFVWIVVGIGVYAWGVYSKTPMVVRGTSIPWGLAVVAAGVLIALWGLWRNRKEI
jgi:hypothetical protein